MSEFCKLDDMNLAERLKKVPEEKHFWNTQLTDAKILLWKMEKQKKVEEKELAKKVVAGSEVTITKGSLDKMVAAGLEKLDDEIKQQGFLISWLELNTKTVSFIAQDFKNIIDFKKVEEF